jgi:hypothetical protein
MKMSPQDPGEPALQVHPESDAIRERMDRIFVPRLRNFDERQLEKETIRALVRRQRLRLEGGRS